MATNQTTQTQNFTIDGIKFFKQHLDKLRYDSMVTDTPITTSEITVFMILHLFVDDMGQIRTLTNDPLISDRKRLCISNLSNDHDLKYETTKKAFDSLLERNYIAEVHTSHGTHYEIVDYALYNQQKNNPSDKEKLNYFRIPRAVFEEKIFGTLIKHRYHKGPIVILELCQYFTRQIGTNRKNVEDVKQVQGERTMTFLKKSLHTTAKRVRDFLSIIHNIFIFKPVNEKVKKPSAERLARTRTFTQICIGKFTFSLNSSCFTEKDHTKERKVYASFKKEMAARIKHAGIPVKWRDTLDINKSISRMVKISSYLDVVNKSKLMLVHTVSEVADRLEDLHIKGELSNIRSLGAFVNKCFSNAWDYFKLTSLTTEDRINVSTVYMKLYGEAPPFFNKDN